MMRLFEREKIRHPLIDFSQDALKLIVNLRNRLTQNEVNMLELDKVVFENILERRLLLTQKFILLDKFYELFFECKIDKEQDEGDLMELSLNGMTIKVNHFLWCLKFAANFDGENINLEKLQITKLYLEKNFFEELNQQEETNHHDNTQEEGQSKKICSHCLEELIKKQKQNNQNSENDHESETKPSE